MATVKERTTEDAAASAGTAYTLSVGDEFEGALTTASDEDWVAVDLVAGRSYDIRLAGAGSDAVTDTMLKVFNAAGQEVASNDDIDWQALELFSMLTFTPDESGTYYLSAGAAPVSDLDNTGAYTLTISDGEDNNTDTPHTVQVGGIFRGALDDKSDEDWIQVDLEQGKTYDITLSGIGADTDTDTILIIYNAAGERLARNDDVDYEGGRIDSKLTFTPDATATYYLSATAYTSSPTQDNAGRYQVAVYDTAANYAQTLTGTAASEYYHTRLTGSIGNDTLDGQGGWDWLEGGGGADRIQGGDGADTVSYQYSPAGVEVRLHDGTARGGDAEGDTFPGTQTLEQALRGGRAQEADAEAAGEPVSPSSSGDDASGQPVSSSSTGDDAGDHPVSSSGAGDPVSTASSGTATPSPVQVPDVEDLFGSAYDDVLAGAQGPNWLSGYYGDDVLYGREGDDWLDGGGGADVIHGGPGDDAALYIYSPEGVEVRLHDGTAKGGYAEGDTFPGKQSVVYTNPEGGAMTLMEPDVEDLYGSFHDDVLAGNHRSNRLRGLDGNDELEGRQGHDVLDGGNGRDWLEGGPGADLLQGGPGQDTASYRSSDASVEVRLHSGVAKGGHAAGDTFAGTIVFAYKDADGQTQRTQLPDVEHLQGSAHDDVLAGDGRANVLSGGDGNDTLYGGPLGGNDRLRGEDGHDKLYGGQGADVLQGGEGNDVLKGGPGDDRLYGDEGNDTLGGGDGADTFFLVPGDGNDTILDFGTGADKLDLSAFGQARTTADLALTQRGDDLVIDLSAHRGGMVTLEDFDRADLTNAQVIFYSTDDATIA